MTIEFSFNRQVTTLLTIKDADPNVLMPLHGITPFHLVIGNDSETFAEEVTKLFLRHGGNPNVRYDYSILIDHYCYYYYPSFLLLVIETVYLKNATFCWTIVRSVLT